MKIKKNYILTLYLIFLILPFKMLFCEKQNLNFSSLFPFSSNSSINLKLTKINIFLSNNKENKINEAALKLKLELEIENKFNYSQIKIYEPHKQFWCIINNTEKYSSQLQKEIIEIGPSEKKNLTLSFKIPDKFIKSDLYYHCPDYGNIIINIMQIGNYTSKTNYEYTNFSISGLNIGIIKLFKGTLNNKIGCYALIGVKNNNNSIYEINSNGLFSIAEDITNISKGIFLNYNKKINQYKKIVLLPEINEELNFFNPNTAKILMIRSSIGSKNIILKRESEK
jgi:hypothetical protein